MCCKRWNQPSRRYDSIVTGPACKWSVESMLDADITLPFAYTGSAIESTQRPGVDAVSLAGLKKTSNVQVRGV